MNKNTFANRLRYSFDNTMSRGAIALIGWLSLLTFLLVTAFAALVVVTGIGPAAEDGNSPGFLSALWMTLMRALDAGTVAGDTGDRSFLAAMFAVTLGG